MRSKEEQELYDEYLKVLVKGWELDDAKEICDELFVVHMKIIDRISKEVLQEVKQEMGTTKELIEELGRREGVTIKEDNEVERFHYDNSPDHNLTKVETFKWVRVRWLKEYKRTIPKEE